jgi:hypothetical protein
VDSVTSIFPSTLETVILTVVLRKSDTWFSILRLRVSEREKWEEKIKSSRVFTCYCYDDKVKQDEQSFERKTRGYSFNIKKNLREEWNEDANWIELTQDCAMEGFHNRVLQIEQPMSS